MGIIYIIKNKINNKVYIGQTTQLVQDRWLKHKSDSKYKDSKLYRAINKYGINNFYYEILEEDIPRNKLDDRERYWIKEYDSYNNGYNSTFGGQDHPTDFDPTNILQAWNEGLSETEICNKLNLSIDRVSRSLIHQLGISKEEINKRKKEYMLKYTDDELLEYWNSGLGIYQIYKSYGGSKDNIKTRLLNLGITLEDIEKRKHEILSNQMRQNRIKNETPIFQFSLTGNLLNKYSSMQEAATLTHSDRSAINHCALGDCPTANGFIWLYTEDYNEVQKRLKRIKGNKKTVFQYSKQEKQLISSFDSIAAAARAVKAKSPSTISTACNRGGGYAHDFYWSFDKI